MDKKKQKNIILIDINKHIKGLNVQINNINHNNIINIDDDVDEK